MLHWNLGKKKKNLITIVCGHQAIIFFFSGTFPAFSFLLFLASICCGGSNSSNSWPSRLALTPLLFIAHSAKLITLVIPYLNVPSQLDWELYEVRDNQETLGSAEPGHSTAQ